MRKDENRFTSLQTAEELIKREMLCILHSDSIHYQTPAQKGFNVSGQKVYSNILTSLQMIVY